MTHFTNLIIGEQNQDINLSTSQDNYAATRSLLSQARRSIDIYSHELDTKIYNQSDCIHALKTFVLNNNRTAQIRILVRQPDRIIKSGHRLIALARHLSGFISIRVIHPNYAAQPDAFLIVDQRGILHLLEGDRYDGLCNFNDPRLGVELSQRFTKVWNHSMEIADFRQLCI